MVTAMASYEIVQSSSRLDNVKTLISRLISGCLLGLTAVTALPAQDWKAVKLPVDEAITGIQFISPDTGFLVTREGTFLRTYDRCATWQTGTVDKTARLEDVSFASTAHGLVCGGYGALYVTEDSGQSWDNVSPGDSAHMYFDVLMVDTRIALVSGMDRGANVPYAGILLRSTNGGRSWLGQESMGMGYSELISTDAGRILLPSFGQLHVSTDQGETWQTRHLGIRGRARALSLSGSTGFLVGPESMCARSTDSGQTWTNLQIEEDRTFVAVEVVNEQTAYIGGLGSHMLVTTDGGQTWKEELMARSFSVLDMALIGDRLYAVGSEAAMVYKIVR